MDRGTEGRASSRLCPAARSGLRHPLLSARGPPARHLSIPVGPHLSSHPLVPPLGGKDFPAARGV